MKVKSLVLIMAVFALYSCRQKAPEENAIPEIPVGFDSASFDEQDQKQYNKARSIFYLLPSPMETTALMHKAGASYRQNILSLAENSKNYATSEEQAVNVGCYLADMSYCNIFQQQEECVKYFAALRVLGDQLDLSGIFTPEIAERIEMNLERRDSILNIISEAYWTAKSELEEAEREKIATYVLAGGWVEGLYIATQLALEDEDNKLLAKRIAEQKYSALHLTELLEIQNSDGSMDRMEQGVRELTDLFMKLEEKKEPSTYSVDEHGVIRVGKKISVKMSREELEQIAQLASKLRNSYVVKE
jgi:hypothetical protein